MNSHEMEKYCNVIMETLWDSTKADEIIIQAATIVDKVAEGTFTRDNIRTEPFTEKVIAACGAGVTATMPKQFILTGL